MRRMTADEWRAKAQALGGGNALDCPFRCPLCGHVATPRDFGKRGGDPRLAPYECIGRLTGARGGLNKGNQPCNWTVDSLFGALGEGIVVVLPEGRETTVFPFAEPARAEEEATR